MDRSGERWRLANATEDVLFELTIYADDSIIPSTLQSTRAAVLDEAACAHPHDAAALVALAAGLDAGERVLVHTGFELLTPLKQVATGKAGRLCWHPLQAAAGSHAALIVHCTEPPSLATPRKR